MVQWMYRQTRMKYLGNYKKWIDPKWIAEILESNGFEGKIVSTSESNKNRYEEYKRAVEAGWSLDTIYWWRYTNQITSFDIKNPPWLDSINRISWWIVKQLPGQVQPMHIDVDENNNCRRFWVPLQDYSPGHILIIENKLIKDYKLGDVFEFNSALDYHGSANIGMTPRVVILITEHLK